MALWLGGSLNPLARQLRRLVFGGLARSYGGVTDSGRNSVPDRPTFWWWVGWVFYGVLFPPVLISETLARTPVEFGAKGIPTFAIAVIGFVVLAAKILRGGKRSAGPGRHLGYLFAAVVANIYLAWAVWLVATRWADIDIAAQDPRRFGLLVWWNILDSVPLIDIDGALDWERPIARYGATIGWLMLIQRLAVLLTLVRSVQVLVLLVTESKDSDAASNHDGHQTDRGA